MSSMAVSGAEPLDDREASLQARNAALERQLQQCQARLQQLEAQLHDRPTVPPLPTPAEQPLFRQVIDHAPFLLWIADRDGNCSFFNQTWLTFRGRSIEQEIGTGWTAGIHPEDVAFCLASYAAAVEACQPFKLEYRLQRVDGAYRWLLDAGVPWFLPDGTCAGYMGSAVDITDRKQAEAALHQREEQLRLALEFAHIGSWNWEISTGEITWNDNHFRLLGLEPRTCQPSYRVWRDRVHPADRDRVQQIAAAAIAQQTDYEAEYRLIHPDGSLHWVVSKGRAIQAESGRALRMVGVLIDITDRKQTEAALIALNTELEDKVAERTQELSGLVEALRHSEARFRAIFEQSQVGIAGLDLEARFILVNQRFCEMVGYGEAELRDRCLADITHPDDLAQDATGMQAILSGERSAVELEKRYIHKTGRIVWVTVTRSPIYSTTGEPQFFLGVVTEITDRKQTEFKLQEVAAQQAQYTAQLEITNTELSIMQEELWQQNFQLAAEQQRYQDLFNFAPDGYVVTDTAGKVLEANRAIAQLLQIKQWFLVGEPLILYIAASDRSGFESLLRQAEQAKRWQTQLAIQPCDRSSLPAEVTISAIENSTQQVIGFRWLIRDITDRQRTEAALRDSEEKFRQLATAITEVFWLRSNQDHQLLYISPSYETMWGRSVESLHANPDDWWQAMHPEDQITILPLIQTQQNQAWDAEYRIIRPDGSLRWIRDRAFPIHDAAGRIYRIAGIADDITDRKQTELALRQSEARYRAIVEDQTELLCRFRSDYTLTFVNSAYCRYYNQPSKELLNRSFLPLIPADEQVFVLASLATLSPAQPVVSYEHQISLPTGERRWHAWTVRVIFDRQAQITEYQAAGRDITAQKLAEAKLKASLAEKEVLLREIHHRVKNNLQMISSLLSLKARSIQDPQMLAPLLESQHRIHTMALIHEKLYSATNLAQIDFAEYVSSLAADLFRSAMPANQISLHTEVAKVELPVDTVISCGLIINELVSNAIKHAFPSGQLGGVLIHFAVVPNDRYTLTVQDNGIGFPRDLELDCSPSLGLRLVRALTHKLRGTIELERNPGTRFQITFPSPR